MSDIDLGTLAQGPHANLIRALADKCAADSRIQAIWVGGSLASGTGDPYSDIDFRIAVEPGQVSGWTTPDWNQYLPIPPYGSFPSQNSKPSHHLAQSRLEGQGP